MTTDTLTDFTEASSGNGVPMYFFSYTSKKTKRIVEDFRYNRAQAQRVVNQIRSSQGIEVKTFVRFEAV